MDKCSQWKFTRINRINKFRVQVICLHLVSVGGVPTRKVGGGGHRNGIRLVRNALVGIAECCSINTYIHIGGHDRSLRPEMCRLTAISVWVLDCTGSTSAPEYRGLIYRMQEQCDT